MQKRLLLLFISLSLGLEAQTWDSIYSYTVLDPIWDKARVDVSQNNEILCSFETINAGNPLSISIDGGSSFQVLLSDFQRGFAGFDGNSNFYLVSEKKNSGVSTNYYDSVYYSDDLGQTIQALDEHPNGGFDYSSFYIDQSNNFYCLDNSLGGNLEPLFALYQNGQFSANISTHLSAGSNALRGVIKLTNGTIVVSTYNDGVHYSSDNGQSWTASQNDQVLGTSTFTSFAQANNGDLFLAGVSLEMSSDNGETWMASNLSTNWVDQVIKAGNGNLYARGAFSSPPLFESTDNGQTWLQMSNQPSGTCADFDLSADHLYAIYDNVLYKYSIGGGSGISLDENHLEVSIFPNPTGQSDLKIKLSQISSANLKILDNQGRIILEKDLGPDNHIERSVFTKPGFYTLYISNDEGWSTSQKLIIN